MTYMSRAFLRFRGTGKIPSFGFRKGSFLLKLFFNHRGHEAHEVFPSPAGDGKGLHREKRDNPVNTVLALAHSPCHPEVSLSPRGNLYLIEGENADGSKAREQKQGIFVCAFAKAKTFVDFVSSVVKNWIEHTCSCGLRVSGGDAGRDGRGI